MWDGKPFEDKGMILAIDEPVLLKTSYYSPLSGKPDTPEKLRRSHLSGRSRRQGLEAHRDAEQYPRREGLAQSESNWAMTLVAIKRLDRGLGHRWG